MKPQMSAPTEEEVDAIWALACDCDRMSVEKTRWHGADAGRRYRECADESCGFFKWVDPPLGARTVEVIAELLNRNNETASRCMRKVDELMDRHEAAMVNLKNKQNRTVVAMFCLFSVMMNMVLNQVTADIVAADYDSEDV